MKRFLVLLLVIAGAATWAVLAVPTNAVDVNGQVITQNQLNSDLNAYAASPDYQCYQNTSTLATTGVPEAVAVNGVEQGDPTQHPTVTTQFVRGYLQSQIYQILISQLAAAHHVTASAADLAESRTGFENQVDQVMGELGQSAEASLAQYSCGHSPSQPLTGAEVVADTSPQLMSQILQTSALYSNLEETIGGVGDSLADLQTYYDSHRSDFDNTCFTVAQYTSASAAQAARGTVYEGGNFSSIATATGGGPQNCEPLSLISSSVPSAHLDTLALNTVSSPIHVGSNYFLLEITKRTPLPFAEVKSVVQQAAQTQGHNRVNALLTAAERTGSITLDPRYGSWAGLKNGVLSPAAPAGVDVLNASANLPAVTPSSSPFVGSGQSG